MKLKVLSRCVILSIALSMFVPFMSYADVGDGTATNKLDPAETGYDFISEGIYYKILGGDSVSTSEGDAPYSGKVVIPDEVVYENKTYKVTKVSGFINSPDVTEVTIPKYTEIISGFYGAPAEWSGGPGIKSPSPRSTTEETLPASKLTKVYFNADDCRMAYYSYSESTMLGGGYYGYQMAFPATVTSVEFGENVTRVPDGLLMGCTEITELIFPKSVKYIGWKIIEPEKDKISRCQLLCVDLQEIGWLPDNQACVELGADFHTYPCGMEHYVYQDIPTGMNYDRSTYSTMFHEFLGLNIAGEEPIELPQWAWNIAPNAFNGCENEFKLELPETMKAIGERAFANCEQLEEITVPASVKNIGASAFEGCTNLKTLSFNATNCEDVAYPYPFSGCTSLNSVVFGEGVTRIPANLFNSCAGLAKVVIPESVTEIGTYAFAFSGLGEITIPKSVNTIGEYAFSECGKLTKVYYDAENCRDANELTFSGCDALECVEFGTSVVAIPNQILQNKSGVKQIVISNSVKTIGERAFYGTGVSELTIPAPVAEIGQSAFYECGNLTTIYFNATDCGLSSSVFGGCESLSVVEFGESVRKIPDYIFLNNFNLSKAIISASVKEIGARAFESSGLTEVTIPVSVEKIGTNAFRDCSSLKAVYFNATDCNTDNAFYYCGVLENIEFGESVTKIPSGLMGYCDNITQVTIPEAVTAIGGMAFVGCNNLTTLYFNAENCEAVVDANGNYNAFGGISNVEFGESVTKIPNHLLYNCRKLKEMNLPESVKEIGAYAFYYTGIIGITIPNSVVSIGDSAFEECWCMTSVTIGNSVETIGSKAFYILGGNDIKTVVSMNVMPPSMPDDAFFTNIYWNAQLSVPTGTLAAYQEAIGWKNFGKVSETDFAGIDDVVISDDAPAAYYNLQGVEVENPQNGVFIKRQGKMVSKVILTR